MDKSADAFRTISEVAEELEVPKHVLRFWEVRFPQIKPMKRGGGRRYYRPADLELLRGIRHLLHNEGYTIKGVQKILREQGVEIVKASLLEAEAASRPPAAAKTGASGKAGAAGKSSASGKSAASGKTGASSAASNRSEPAREAKRRLPTITSTGAARGPRASATPRDRNSVIAGVIRELEAAREILVGKPAAVKAGARGRARR